MSKISPSGSGTMDVDIHALPRHAKTMTDCLHPLLTSMKLFGLYFVRQREAADTIPGRKWRRCNAWMIHGMFVVALMWINVVRIFSIFTPEDKFGLALLNKAISVIWAIQCAILQTAFYASSHRGSLQDVFMKKKLSDECAVYLSRIAVVYTAVAWLIIAIGSAFFLYGLFFTVYMDDMLTPLNTHLPIDNPLVPRIFMYLFSFYLIAAHVFTQAMTFLLAMLHRFQFNRVTNSLGSQIDSQEGQVEDDEFEALRQEHQKISMSLGNIDGCLMFSNAAAFCGQLACFIIILYTIMFFHVVISDPMVITTLVFWMILMSLGLVFTAAGGIIVNNSVSLVRLSVLTLITIARSRAKLIVRPIDVSIR